MSCPVSSAIASRGFLLSSGRVPILHKSLTNTDAHPLAEAIGFFRYVPYASLATNTCRASFKHGEATSKNRRRKIIKREKFRYTGRKIIKCIDRWVFVRRTIIKKKMKDIRGRSKGVGSPMGHWQSRLTLCAEMLRIIQKWKNFARTREREKKCIGIVPLYSFAFETGN